MGELAQQHQQLGTRGRLAAGYKAHGRLGAARVEAIARLDEVGFGCRIQKLVRGQGLVKVTLSGDATRLYQVGRLDVGAGVQEQLLAGCHARDGPVVTAVHASTHLRIGGGPRVAAVQGQEVRLRSRVWLVWQNECRGRPLFR